MFQGYHAYYFDDLYIGPGIYFVRIDGVNSREIEECTGKMVIR